MEFCEARKHTYPDGLTIMGDLEYWFKDGFFHRENGPAIRNIITGDSHYCQNGLLHRLDGPAIDHGTYRVWAYQGYIIQCNNSQEEFERLIKMRAFW